MKNAIFGLRIPLRDSKTPIWRRVAVLLKGIEVLTRNRFIQAYRCGLVTTEVRDYAAAEQLLDRIRDAAADTTTSRPRRRLRKVTT